MSTDLFGNPDNTQTPQAPQEPAPQAPAAQEPPATQPPAQAPTDPNSLFADQLAAITSPDGRQKYADVPTALSSIPHAQAHIAQLQAELEETKQELAKRQGAEEVLKQFQSNQPPAQETPSVAGIDETTATALIEQAFVQKEAQRVAEANRATVINALTAQYGEKAEEQFVAKANELGMDVQSFTALALQSPQAVLSQFSKPAPAASPTTPGTRNTVAFGESPQGKNPDVMSRFTTGGPSDLVSKWRAVAQKS